MTKKRIESKKKQEQSIIRNDCSRSFYMKNVNLIIKNDPSGCYKRVYCMIQRNNLNSASFNKDRIPMSLLDVNNLSQAYTSD